MSNGQNAVIEQAGQRLIVTNSDRRAKKDAYNLERGLKQHRNRIGLGQSGGASAAW